MSIDLNVILGYKVIHGQCFEAPLSHAALYGGEILDSAHSLVRDFLLSYHMFDIQSPSQVLSNLDRLCSAFDMKTVNHCPSQAPHSKSRD